MIRFIIAALFVLFLASCTDGAVFSIDVTSPVDVVDDVGDVSQQDVVVDSYANVDTLLEDTSAIDTADSSAEDISFFPDIWHKPACGQKKACTSSTECQVPGEDSCIVHYCSFPDGCCEEYGDPYCCHQDKDCAQDETCESGQCKKFTCPPAGMPGECFVFSIPYRNVCFTLYSPCTSRPVDCRHDTDCWQDSTCVDNHCQQLDCTAGLDVGCYKTDMQPFAADWRCVYTLQPDGTTCDDGDPCTSGTCNGGQCRGVGLAGCDPP